MNAYLEKLRVVNCEFDNGKVAQKPYCINSLNLPVWGCIRECSHVYCEYNMNPKQEALRRNLFGRMGIC